MPDWLPSVLLFLGSVILSVIAWFLRQTYMEIVKRQDKAEAAHAQLRADFEQFREQLPYRYVLRDDWIRATVNLEQKMDRLLQLVMQLMQREGVKQ